LERWLPVSLPLAWRIGCDYLGLLLLSAVTLLGFNWVFVNLLTRWEHRYNLRLIRRLPRIFKAMVGEDIFQMITPTALNAVAYIHPITLVVLLAYAVVLPSGVIVGQIDRGTIDFVLATPLTRRKMMATTIASSLLGGAVLVVSCLVGTWLGIRYTQLDEPPDFHAIAICAVNLYVLYAVVLGYSLFFSAVSSLRSWAVGWAIGVSLAGYLVHFFSEYWEWMQKIAFLGPLDYFHPVKIAASGQWPVRDMIVLAVAAAVLMLASTLAFCRRNIATT